MTEINCSTFQSDHILFSGKSMRLTLIHVKTVIFNLQYLLFSIIIVIQYNESVFGKENASCLNVSICIKTKTPTARLLNPRSISLTYASITYSYVILIFNFDNDIVIQILKGLCTIVTMVLEIYLSFSTRTTTPLAGLGRGL